MSDASTAAGLALWGFICGVFTIGYFIWLLIAVTSIRSDLREIAETLKDRLPPPPIPGSQLFSTPDRPPDLNQRREETRAKLTPELEKSLAFAPKESSEKKQP
jgi:hypothetical protein